MISFTTIFIAIVSIAIYYYFRRDKRMEKFPPGPKGLPLIGNVLQVGSNSHISYLEFSKKYGKTIGINLAVERLVVLHDVKMIRDIFNQTVFSGRPQGELFLILAEGNYGVLASEGPIWESQRRFTLRRLRDFGLGKNTMENLIMEEVKEIISWMASCKGGPLSVNGKFTLAVLNSLWVILSGKRFDQNDATFTAMFDTAMKNFNEVFQGVLVFAPWIGKIFPKLTGYDRMMKSVDDLMNFFKNTVKEHKENPRDPPVDFIDYYLQEIEKTSDPESHFYKETGEKNLVAIVSDMFQAGSETTSTTLSWLILYLLKNPQVQTKLHEELDNVIGQQRLPSLADRPNLPYTEAVIMELLRYSCILPIGAFHSTIFDIEWNGFFFPKGSWIVANIYAVHFDKEIWGDPKSFRPERFLKDGKLIPKPDALLIFASGKRACIGETFARDTLFLFTTSIFQRFQVLPNPADPDPTIEPGPGFILAPKPFTVIMKDRLNN